MIKEKFHTIYKNFLKPIGSLKNFRVIYFIFCLQIHQIYDFWDESTVANSKWDKLSGFLNINSVFLNRFEKTSLSYESYHQETNTLKELFQPFKQKILKNKKPLTNKINKTSKFTWNDLCELNKDYIYHGLTLTSFNQAFDLLDDNREFLDYLAEYLLHFEIIRPRFILEFVSRFFSAYNSLKNKKLTYERATDSILSDKLNAIKDFNKKEKINKIIRRKLGKDSILTSVEFFTFTSDSNPKKKQN